MLGDYILLHFKPIYIPAMVILEDSRRVPTHKLQALLLVPRAFEEVMRGFGILKKSKGHGIPGGEGASITEQEENIAKVDNGLTEDDTGGEFNCKSEKEPDEGMTMKSNQNEGKPPSVVEEETSTDKDMPPSKEEEGPSSDMEIDEMEGSTNDTPKKGEAEPDAATPTTQRENNSATALALTRSSPYSSLCEKKEDVAQNNNADATNDIAEENKKTSSKLDRQTHRANLATVHVELIGESEDASEDEIASTPIEERTFIPSHNTYLSFHGRSKYADMRQYDGYPWNMGYEVRISHYGRLKPEEIAK